MNIQSIGVNMIKKKTLVLFLLLIIQSLIYNVQISNAQSQDYKDFPFIYQWGTSGLPSEGFVNFATSDNGGRCEIIPELGDHQYPLEFYDNSTTNDTFSYSGGFFNQSLFKSSYYISFWIRTTDVNKTSALRLFTKDWDELIYEIRINNGSFEFVGYNGIEILDNILNDTWYHLCIRDEIMENDHFIEMYIDGTLKLTGKSRKLGEIAIAYISTRSDDYNFSIYLDALYIGNKEEETFATMGGFVTYGEDPIFVSTPENNSYEPWTLDNYNYWKIEDLTVNSSATYTIFQNDIPIPEHTNQSWISKSSILLNVNNLNYGEYYYRIEVNDGYGGYISDTVKITIENLPPRIFAEFSKFFENINIAYVLTIVVIGIISMILNSKSEKFLISAAYKKNLKLNE